jgi:alkanesulfonate monooxygenase SsuD/methylene tetrahydromethanopterin reductase-like flavin-dependent oxidoreductase (luciferase family)
MNEKNTPANNNCGGVFMARLVAVDPNLAPVKEHLSSQGYQIVDADVAVRPVEAVVYSGPPLAGGSGVRQAAAENTVLVNAAGLTPEEVASQLDNKLG